MLSAKLSIVLFVILLFSYSISEEDYDDDDDEGQNEFEDCEYEVDFKSYKKTKKLDLCDALKTPSLKSRIQLHIYSNHTEEKIHLRALSLPSTNSNKNKSLISLTTDIIEDFKYPTSLLIIDNYQFISLSTLQSILSSLINIDLNLLSKNLKKTLFITKGGHKQILSCSGTFYPKQDIKTLNLTSVFTKPITCTKEPQHDRFFTLQEKIYLNEKNFNLIDIHQDDQKKISRTSWYTCNNPKACNNGLQNKKNLDQTVNYVLKFLQNGRMEKKTSSG